MKVGILGGGQLGQMLAHAARELSMEPIVLDPKPDAVAAQAARHLIADYEDPDALDELAGCEVVTYEFENVPTSALERLAPRVAVRPPVAALAISGDRLQEKDFFRDLGIATAPFRAIETRADLDSAVTALGFPAILKTRRFGYDGKGQALLRAAADVESAWEELGGHASARGLVLEGFVPFDREVSVLAARGVDGSMCYWPPTENLHVGGILSVSRAPARDVSEALFGKAKTALEAVMAKLDYVGVLVVEFFQVGDELIANEMACRVHNSGHWTIEGSVTSQFANHLRAVTGRPLGASELTGPAAMVNLVGEIPDLSAFENDPEIHVHIYGKSPAPGRKLGHVTIVAPTARSGRGGTFDRDAFEAARARVEEKVARVLQVLGNRPD